MEINYIFVLKEKIHIENTVYNQVENMLLDLFSVSELDCFDAQDDKGSHYKIHTKLSMEEENDNIVYYKIICNLSEAKSAEILDNVSNTITQGKHREDFHIIKSYDEVSHSFCCRLMSPLGVFERRLRQLIYLTVLKCFGNKWIKETFEEQLQNKLKEQTHGGKMEKLIENALEELTYEQISHYLFEPKRLLSLEDLVDNQLSKEKINHLSKDKIIHYINQARKISLWDQLFQRYQNILSTSKDMSDDIKDLQSKRNKVMHHKTLSFEEFTTARTKLKIVNQKLEKAINIAEAKTYDDYDYINIAKCFSQVIEQTAKQFVENTISSLAIIALAKTLENFIKSYEEKAVCISSEIMPPKSSTHKIIPGLTISQKAVPTINTELPITKSQHPIISTKISDEDK